MRGTMSLKFTVFHVFTLHLDYTKMFLDNEIQNFSEGTAIET